MLVNGRWSEDWHPFQAKDDKGRFIRQSSRFRGAVTSDGSSGFKAEAGRYHLYVALICPWASRTLAARKLKGLEEAISVSVAEPAMGPQGWELREGADPVNGARFIHELYSKADPSYTGRATVPVLWDRKTDTIVNNESADIVRMLNDGFGSLAKSAVDLYPAGLRSQIDQLNERIYGALNNGVYRCGFASTQEAYEEAFGEVFGALDEMERRVEQGPYLFGEALTETDIRLFVTLIRFDAAYYGLFKCNLRRIRDYRNLTAYLDRLLAIPAFRETVNISHIKRGYYAIKALNPSGIVPLGPEGPVLEATGL
jgi:glutathionyl-hydroquinone reductase